MKQIKKEAATNRFGVDHCRTRLLAVFLIAGTSIGLAACTNPENDGKSTNAPKAESSIEATSPLKGLNGVGKNTLFSIDIINGQAIPKAGPVVISTQEVTVGGWAVDQQAKSPAGSVYVTVDGKKDLPTAYGNERKDVADALKNPNYKNSGFAALILSSTLDKGRHTLGLKIVTADKKGYYEPDQKIEIEVR